jgi:hypothetical protein
MNDEVERMWKEPVLSCCKILSKYLLERLRRTIRTSGWIASQAYNQFQEFPN